MIVTDLTRELRSQHLAIAQPQDPPLMTAEPMTGVQPYLWRWNTIEPLLEEVAAAVALDPGGNRRTLRLVNPGLPYGTTHTIWAGIQQVLPGEIATAHRHTPNAFRFIIQGRGVSTTVDGQRMPMEPGDVLLTPNWCWHDHQNTGAEKAFWIDGLDIPLVRSLNAMFFEPYSEATQQVQQAGGADGPIYKSADSLAELRRRAEGDLDPFDDVLLELRGPDSRPALRTIGLGLQLLQPGTITRPHRHTSSVVYHVVSGQGCTLIEGQRLDWTSRDFLVVPPWAWHEHRNDSGMDAILFQMNDAPVLQALGLYREEAG